MTPPTLKSIILAAIEDNKRSANPLTLAELAASLEVSVDSIDATARTFGVRAAAPRKQGEGFLRAYSNGRTTWHLRLPPKILRAAGFYRRNAVIAYRAEPGRIIIEEAH